MKDAPRREDQEPAAPQPQGSGTSGRFGHPAPQESNVLGVFGLSIRTRERDLEDEFYKSGDVKKVVVVYDQRSQRSRGFGFVTMGSIQDATRAIADLNGIELHGRKIRVDFSLTNRPHDPTPGQYMGVIDDRDRFPFPSRRDDYRRDDYRRDDRRDDYRRDDRDRRDRYDDRDRRDRYDDRRDDRDRRDRYDDRRDSRRDSPPPRRRRSPSPRRSRSRSPDRRPPPPARDDY